MQEDQKRRDRNFGKNAIKEKNIFSVFKQLWNEVDIKAEKMRENFIEILLISLLYD